MWSFIVAIVVVIVILFILFLVFFNGIVNADNNARKLFLNLDFYLIKRLNLLPNIITLVNRYPNYEKGTVDRLLFLMKTDYNKLLENNKIIINQELTILVSSLMNIVKYYPELKKDSLYQNIFKQLMLLESEIEVERTRYNKIVEKYNKKINSFIGKIIANLFKFNIRTVLNLS